MSEQTTPTPAAWIERMDKAKYEIWLDYAQNANDLVDKRCVKMAGLLPISIMTREQLSRYASGRNRDRAIVISFAWDGEERVDLSYAKNNIVDALHLTVPKDTVRMPDPPAPEFSILSQADAMEIAEFVARHIAGETFDYLIIQGEDGDGGIPTYRPNPYIWRVETRMEGGFYGLARTSGIAAALVEFFGYSPRYYLYGSDYTPDLGVFCQTLMALEQPSVLMDTARETFARYGREIADGKRADVRHTW